VQPSTGARSPRQHSWRGWAIVAVAVAALLFVGSIVLVLRFLPSTPALAAGPPATPSATPVLYCTTKEGAKVYDLVARYATEWDDANKLVAASTRMTMSPQVAELQRIRRDVSTQMYPECGQRAQRALVDAMDSMINGYISFLKQDQDYITTGYFKTANGQMERFGTALAALNGPLPAATPAATPVR